MDQPRRQPIDYVLRHVIVAEREDSGERAVQDLDLHPSPTGEPAVLIGRLAGHADKAIGALWHRSQSLQYKLSREIQTDGDPARQWSKSVGRCGDLHESTGQTWYFKDVR